MNPYKSMENSYSCMPINFKCSLVKQPLKLGYEWQLLQTTTDAITYLCLIPMKVDENISDDLYWHGSLTIFAKLKTVVCNLCTDLSSLCNIQEPIYYMESVTFHWSWYPPYVCFGIQTAAECMEWTRIKYRYVQICINLLLFFHDHPIFVFESHRPKSNLFYWSISTIGLA